VKCFGDEILIKKNNNYNYSNNYSSNNEFKYYDTDDVSISNLNFFVRAFENNETLNNDFNNNNSNSINSSNNNNNSNEEFLISNFSPLLQGPINIHRGHHDGVKLCEETNKQNLKKTLPNKQNISNITEEEQTSTSKKTNNSNNNNNKIIANDICIPKFKSKIVNLKKNSEDYNDPPPIIVVSFSTNEVDFFFIDSNNFYVSVF
jgi:hypothetical protein